MSYNTHYDENGVRLNDGASMSLDIRHHMEDGSFRKDWTCGLSNHRFDHARRSGQAAIINVHGPSRDMGLTAAQARVLGEKLIEAAEEQEDYEAEEKANRFLDKVMELANASGIVVEHIVID